MNQRGNALFLILIAVALFAALSYAVTQSGRSGGGVDKEKAIIEAAEITQFASMLHQTVNRMVLTGTTIANLEFEDVFASATPCTSGENCVFDPAGGAAIWNDEWWYKPAGTNWVVSGIGTAIEDIVIVKPYLSLETCTQINKGLGLTTPPPTETTMLVVWGINQTVDEAFPSGTSFGCLDSNSIYGYTYFHVVVEQ